MTPEERDALLKLWRRWPECRPFRVELLWFAIGGQPLDESEAADLACAAIEKAIIGTMEDDFGCDWEPQKGWGVSLFRSSKGECEHHRSGTKLSALIAAANALLDAEAKA